MTPTSTPTHVEIEPTPADPGTGAGSSHQLPTGPASAQPQLPTGPGSAQPPGDGPGSSHPLPTGPGARLTSWCVRRKWWVFLVSALLAVGSVLLLSTGIVKTPNDERLVGDSAEAVAILERADFGAGPTEHVVATTKSERLDPADAVALGERLAAAYRGVDGVAAVGQPFPGQDGRSVVVPVQLRAARSNHDSSLPQPAEAVPPMLETTRRLAAENPGYAIGQVGPGSIAKEFDDILGRDFQRAELISLPVTLLVLLVAFGAVVAAGVPLVLGIGSVLAALGLTAAVSQHIVTVDPNTQSLVLLIGLAVGVDYALFIMRRAREERAAGASVEESIVRAGATAGRAVLVSGLTVMVAMAGMLVAGGLFTSLAVAPCSSSGSPCWPRRPCSRRSWRSSATGSRPGGCR